jgi:hypothetical protein
MWRTIDADGCVWEVRAVHNPYLGVDPSRELLEFRPRDGNRPPRHVLGGTTRLDEMDDIELRAAYLQSRPIGGDHYGRPGKRMRDTGTSG